MTKFVVISLNLLALLFYNLFFGGDVTIEQSFPESIEAGESFTVEITINKGDRQGFAKWQQSLPEGFIAESKETQGATFSFKNQDVKLIWMALPEEESFTISYEVFSEPMIQGNFELNGKFSFIENNERKDIMSFVKMIEVKAASDVFMGDMADYETESDSSSSQTEDSTTAMTEGEKEDTSITSPSDKVIAESSTQSDDSTYTMEVTADKKNDKSLVTNTDKVKINRQVEHLEGGKYNITLNIEKGDFNSFGKVEEYLPPGFLASEDQNNEGIFSFEDNVMKILWMAIPKRENLKVSYFIESTTDELDSVTVHGVFSYLDEDQSKQVALKGTRFKNFYVAPEPIAEVKEEIQEAFEAEEQTDTIEEAMEVAEQVEQPIEEDQINEPDKEAVNPDEESSDIAEEISNIPSPETNVRYKVQIAAAKKEVNQQYFISRHGITENISTEFHDSWYKYTLGSYEIYRQARDKRNEIWNADNKINDAFVAAYNAGERITVQEALMITKQKWYK